MAARKKATGKSSRSVAKKGKTSTGSSASRKRKSVAATPAARSSRSAAKRKTTRTAKVKTRKSEAARRASAAVRTTKTKSTKAPKSATSKSRATHAKRRAAKTAATKPGKSLDMKLQAHENLARETAKSTASKASPAVESKTAHEAQATAKGGPAPLAKRAPIAPKAVAKPAAPQAAGEIEDEAAAPRAAQAPKAAGPRQGFKLNEFVVYPAHGVGQIVAVEDQEVAGFRLELFVINFSKDKMTLRVPTSKVAGVGMRKLSEPDVARKSLDILTGRARIKRTMWSRRAQEYEAKINSGDINAIAEVVRDLYRSEAQPEQSYSERQLYEAALDRMMREIAAVQKLSEIDALKVIEGQLKKSVRRSAKTEAAESDDGAIEEAA
jgi:CarD family transcriptional regulator, regulator of rRNA transcription